MRQQHSATRHTSERNGQDGQVEALLSASRRGDQTALDQLYGLLYDELRVIAHRQLRELQGPARQTLSTTALVHESYLKLVRGAPVHGQQRVQFFAVASRVMRSILVDYARAQGAAKRGGDALRVSLQDNVAIAGEQSADLLALDDALSRLNSNLPRLGQVVECRFFGGMTVEETAEALDCSVRTVEREWTRARAYLATLLQHD